MKLVRILFAPCDILQVGGQIRDHTFYVVQWPAAPAFYLVPGAPYEIIIHPDRFFHAGGELRSIAAAGDPCARGHSAAGTRVAFDSRRPCEEPVDPDTFGNYIGHPRQFGITYISLHGIIAIGTTPVSFEQIEFLHVTAQAEVFKFAAKSPVGSIFHIRIAGDFRRQSQHTQIVVGVTAIVARGMHVHRR